MNIKRELITWGSVIVIGGLVGIPLGKYAYNHSQNHRVLVFQTDTLNMLEGKHDKEKTQKDMLALVDNAKDFMKCADTVDKQYKELDVSISSMGNSCSQAEYTQTSSRDSWVNPADILEKYERLLRENCK